MENTPEVTHTTNDSPTLPVPFDTPLGETKIPDPMILPTITVIPFKRLILGFRQIASLAGLGSTGEAGFEVVLMPSLSGDLSEDSVVAIARERSFPVIWMPALSAMKVPRVRTCAMGVAGWRMGERIDRQKPPITI